MSILGMVFTDKTGQVVFANRHVYVLMGLNPQRDQVVGLPLDKVLRIEVEQARQLTVDPRGGVTVEVVTQPKNLDHLLRIRSEPAYDDRRSFIGSNISIAYADPSVASATREALANEAAKLHAYFLAMLEGLEVLLARMGGLNVRAAVDDIVIEAAGDDLQVSIREGQFTIGGELLLDRRKALYRAILDEVITYGFDIAGAFLVEQTIAAVEEDLDPVVVKAAEAIRYRG